MKRPPKPRIVKARLKWVWKHRSEGGRWEPYHRVTWFENGKRRERAILLKWQGDARLLDELWWKCEAGNHSQQQAPDPNYTWRAAFELWKADPRIKNRPGKIKDYGAGIDHLMGNNANKDMRKSTKAGFRKKHASLFETPRQADRFLQFSSMLWNYVRDKQDWPLGPNPVKGIDHFGKQREYEPWPPWMVDKLSEAPEVVEIAARLILGTGQRPAAAILMERSHFNGDYMSMLDEKSDTRFDVFCPPKLRAFISALPHRGTFILGKNLTEPMGYNTVEKAFRNWRDGLGPAAKPYVLHGLRKLAIIELAEAGWTDAEIQARTNQSPEMVAFYRKKASRKSLTRAAWERNRNGT
ncbi:MAG: hypothetical protein AAGF94_18150 [Pseudomonadota bacterium]